MGCFLFLSVCVLTPWGTVHLSKCNSDRTDSGHSPTPIRALPSSASFRAEFSTVCLLHNSVSSWQPRSQFSTLFPQSCTSPRHMLMMVSCNQTIYQAVSEITPLSRSLLQMDWQVSTSLSQGDILGLTTQLLYTSRYKGLAPCLKDNKMGQMIN